MIHNTWRIGQGYDVHRFEVGRKLVLGGIVIPFHMGLDGHSDADVLTHAIIDAILGAAGLAWWLFSEAERRQQTKKHKAMLYAPRMQDGSEAFENNYSSSNKVEDSEKLEERVEQLNAAIADVRKQLEDLGARNS